MPYKAKNMRKSTSVPAALLAGLLTNWAITVLLAMIIGGLVNGDRVGEHFTPPAAVATVLLSATAGAIVAARKAGARRMLISVISGAIYFLSLLCCNALFFDGTYQAVGATALSIVGCCLLVGLAEIRQKGGKIKGIKRLR